MASPTEIRKGKVIVYQGTPHLVLEMQHRTQVDKLALYKRHYEVTKRVHHYNEISLD